ncbi:Glucose 1-dehydrogenase [Pediococcus damnosus]|uniref:Glucose 1-dehydrogenase n=1 Tax=Pediococcus damnosus TaxID=51663 RepID=A0A143AKL6_9LACO|nr:hypothetical protein [Pediococcus damnosus]AMV60212.1 Glucose 1-dehydrogenase [Pediococcus damnosus]AMV62738.1 Glucose 1-dehydrogenase [Pediococcus damnosus]AMV64462.1 Glucose 1-dehydrogenase [Pediococcus damnosus]AMV67379.1 Glucose 1-dehydrogenase [Pediococcus damnosus]AMV69678.1 Glucose 1-dehydrogenase [Pediococcus damnosus]
MAPDLKDPRYLDHEDGFDKQNQDTPVLQDKMVPVSDCSESSYRGNHRLASQRADHPVAIAPVYNFLASSEASYVTAQIYGVAGGEAINL